MYRRSAFENLSIFFLKWTAKLMPTEGILNNFGKNTEIKVKSTIYPLAYKAYLKDYTSFTMFDYTNCLVRYEEVTCHLCYLFS